MSLKKLITEQISNSDKIRVYNIVQPARSYADSRIEFINNLRRIVNEISDKDKQLLTDFIKHVNQEATKNCNEKLYHGTPHYEDIRDEGFKLTKGKRAGFLGGNREVDNLGIFLTDSNELAKFYGENRGMDYEVLEVCYRGGDILDIHNDSKVNKEIKRLGVKLLNDYEGSNKSRLAKSDYWWIFDQPKVINLIKEKGYNGVKFKESPNVVKQSGVKDGFTYLIFNPNDLFLYKKPIKQLADLMDYDFNL